jgi:hypothetical protein
MFFAASRRVVAAATARSAAARYVPLLLDQVDAPMRAVDVAKQARPGGTSAYSSARRLKLALGAIRQAFEERRARRART